MEVWPIIHAYDCRTLVHVRVVKSNYIMPSHTNTTAYSVPFYVCLRMMAQKYRAYIYISTCYQPIIIYLHVYIRAPCVSHTQIILYAIMYII